MPDPDPLRTPPLTRPQLEAGIHAAVKAAGDPVPDLTPAYPPPCPTCGGSDTTPAYCHGARYCRQCRLNYPCPTEAEWLRARIAGLEAERDAEAEANRRLADMVLAVSLGEEPETWELHGLRARVAELAAERDRYRAALESVVSDLGFFSRPTVDKGRNALAVARAVLAGAPGPGGAEPAPGEAPR